jgi:UV DNA damage endonuclease
MIKYGLTCIPEILKERDKTLAYRTMTRKRFNDLGRVDGLKQLSERILHNMRFAKRVVEHCAELGIHHYRIPESFPLMTDPQLNIDWSELPDEQEIYDAIEEIGETAKKLNVRIGCHPDQFVILASPREEVRDKSVIDLKLAGWFFDKMGLPQNHEAPINIHTSCSIKEGSSLEQIGDRIYDSLMKCGSSVYTRFTLENEDKSSFNCETLYNLHCYIKDTYNFIIPLVFDNCHHKCNTSSKFDVDYLSLFKSTWPSGITPVMHWSEGGENGNKRAHVQYITEAVGAPIDDSVVWELEVKAKDKAIVELMKIVT